MKRTLLHFILLFLCVPAFGAADFWIFFTEKDSCAAPAISSATLENRRMAGLPQWQYSDLPVSAAYIEQVEAITCAEKVVPSRWLNALAVDLPENADRHTIAQEVLELPFVRKISPTRSYLVPAGSTFSNASYAGYQIGAEALRKKGLDGEGVVIGLIDAGFHKADKSKALRHLYKENRVLGERDYLDPERKDFYRNLHSLADIHGTEVLEAIAGVDKDGNPAGLATGASFYLARTDEGRHENRIEEAHWIAALEWMDSLGVRLVNSSLGYSDGFDDPDENHLPEEMDGNTLLVSKAAEIASAEKGMLIIVSAGNEAEKKWRILSAPADAPGVLAVGSCGLAGERMGFSSIGPAFLKDVKPEVCCYSNSGTSFSAPVITGLAACLIQQNDTLTGPEVKQIIEQSGNLYPYGNNFTGYGVPQAAAAMLLASDMADSLHGPEVKNITADTYTIQPEWMEDEAVVIFYKSSPYLVEKQRVLRTGGQPLMLERDSTITHTTVQAGNKVIELVWE